MAPIIKTIPVSIDLTEQENGMIRFLVGSFGYPIQISELQRIMGQVTENDMSPDYMINMIAMAAKKAGLDGTDLLALKTTVESSLTFGI